MRASRLRRAPGFTLFETVIVIGLLSLCATGLVTMLPQVFKAQNEIGRAHV